jgi:hypothetical protein
MNDFAFAVLSALIITGVSLIYLTYIMWKEDKDV